MDKSFCEFIADIKKDPTKSVGALKIKDFLALKAHLGTCQACSDTVDEVIEDNKNAPSSANSDWNNTKYN